MITHFINCSPEDASHVRVFNSDGSGGANFFPIERDGSGGANFFPIERDDEHWTIQFEAGAVLLSRSDIENLLGKTCWRLEEEVTVVTIRSETQELGGAFDLAPTADEDDYFKVNLYLPNACKGKRGVLTLDYEE